MDKNLSVNEFETLVTMRALTCSEICFETSLQMQIGIKVKNAANDLVDEFKLNDKFRAKTTAVGRVLLLHIPTKRVACELCIDGIYKDGEIRQPRVILMSRRGYVKEKTLTELANNINARGVSTFRKGSYGRNHQN
ncbi:MAG: hypothetical protein Q4E47_03385 [Candidatus Saccharibacteria bacterium]|nr:hypothetical protein [Candidatus Saccharibacteria bacterium]